MTPETNKRPLDYPCGEGTISNTFYNNDYMRLPVNRWKQSGAKERVLKLVEELRAAISGRMRQET